MIQSLIPAIYPIIKSGLWIGFRSGRADHADLPDFGIAAAAGRRPLHRSASDAVFDGRRHGLSLIGPDRPGLCRQLCPSAGVGGLRRARLIHLPSRGDADGAQRLRRQAGSGPGRFSRSAASRAARWARCSPPSSSCRGGRHRSPGSRSPALIAMVLMVWTVGQLCALSALHEAGRGRRAMWRLQTAAARPVHGDQRRSLSRSRS